MNGTDKQKNTGPTRSEKRQPRGRWKDSHIILLVLPVVLTILFPVGGLFYLCGRFRPYTLTLWDVSLLYLAVVVFMVYCFFSGIVRLFSRTKKSTRTEKLLIIAETGIPLVFAGLFLVPFFFAKAELCGRPYDLFMFGLRDRIESKVDIGATRTWLQSFNVEDLDVHYNVKPGYSLIPRSECPRSLRVLKADGVLLSADKNGNAKVRLDWGSGFMGHWGVEIGMKDMETPPSDFGMHGEHRLPVEPGVYVWWGE